MNSKRRRSWDRDVCSAMGIEIGGSCSQLALFRRRMVGMKLVQLSQSAVRYGWMTSPDHVEVGPIVKAES